MELSNQGKIETGTFAKVLVFIHSSKFTGTVGLTKGEIKKVIIFSLGRPVASRSNVINETLGGMLIELKRITKEQLTGFINELKREKNGMQIGELLVSKKIISPMELEEFLKIQLTDRLKRVLLWEDGEYKIVEGKIAETGMVNLGKNIPEIIYEGFKEIKDLSKLKEFVPSGSIPVRAGGSGIKLEEIKLSGKELGFLRLVNGTNSVEKIVADSKLDELTLLGFLSALESLGQISIQILEPAKPKTQPPVVHNPQVSNKPAHISESSSKLANEISAMLKGLEGKNYFQYFGFEKNASSENFKGAYFSFAKNFHPDRLPKDFSGEMRKDGEKLFSIMTEAYSVIFDEKKKNDYLAKLELEAQGITQNPTQVAESELEFQKGQIMLKKADFDGAAEFFKRAIALYPEEPEYYIHLGFAFFRKGSKSKDTNMLSRAKVEIEKGLSKNPNADKGYLYLGHIAKFEQNLDKAKKYYTKAVEVNPNCLEASSELRLMSSRDEKKGAGKGAFKR